MQRKPSGNASVLLGCASGIHGDHSPRYIRTGVPILPTVNVPRTRERLRVAEWVQSRIIQHIRREDIERGWRVKAAWARRVA